MVLIKAKLFYEGEIMTRYYMRKFKDKETIKIGYARVSSVDNRQELGLAVQKEALKGCDIVFVEKESGSQDQRPKLQQALQLAKNLASQGQSVSLVIYRLDRLTRKMFTLVEILKSLTDHHIQLVSLKEKLETDSLTGKLLVVILGYVAEMELEAIRSRTKDGLRKAKEKGVTLGRKSLSTAVEQQIIQLYTTTTLSSKAIAQDLNVSRATVYNVLKRNQIPLRKQNKV